MADDKLRLAAAIASYSSQRQKDVDEVGLDLQYYWGGKGRGEV